MNDNSLWDWRIAVNAKKLAWIFLEIVICAVHPFPSARQCEGEQELERASQDLPFLSEADILLSTLMFLRVYLLPRTVLLHSRVLVDASYRSIGSLNKIKFQYQFVMKILMNTYPARVLLILTIGLWIISSWVLSVCEREKGQATGNLASTMWLIPITFLTIGYGDVVPHTVCGRMVCLCTGVMVKCAAANVLGEAWLLYRHTKGGDSAKIRQHQRNLLGAIHIFRHRRRKHKTLQDQVNAMVDISKMQMLMYDMDLNLNSSHRDLEKRIDQLDKKLDEISRLIMTAIESPRQ
ncbi:hypothetical protein FKM82_013017 [Ascaphus truei]